MTKRKRVKCMDCASVIATLELMADGKPRTIREIYEALGCSQPTADQVMDSLRHHRRAYIADYIPVCDGRSAAVWALGDERNAPQPRRRSAAYRAAMMRIYRRRHEDKKAGRITDGTPHRHPQDIALFGEYRRAA